MNKVMSFQKKKKERLIQFPLLKKKKKRYILHISESESDSFGGERDEWSKEEGN